MPDESVVFQSETPATPPAGFEPAGDVVGGKFYQRVKPDFGGDGVSVPATANADGGQNVHVTNPSDFPAGGGGGLTDVQLRATPVPVSGPLSDAQLRASAVPVSGPITDAQLRAAAVPVSQGSVPLPTGSGSIVDGTLAAVVGAAALGAQACKAVLLQADPDNTADVFIGSATNQRFQLVPGQTVTLPVSNVNLVFGRSASGTQSINWLAIT